MNSHNQQSIKLPLFLLILTWTSHNHTGILCIFKVWKYFQQHTRIKSQAHLVALTG